MRPERTRNLLGHWLIKEGIITPEQLDEALESQAVHKGEKGPLGKALVKKGYCTEEDIAKVIARRAGVPYLSLEKHPINLAALASIPPEAIRRYRALPVDFKEDKLLVAMQRPGDIMAIDDLRALSGFDIVPIVIPDTELEMALEKYSRNDDFRSVEEEEEADSSTIMVGEEQDDERPAVQLANAIISQGINVKASDIHIEPYEKRLRVRFRMDGVLHEMMQPPLRLHGALVSRIKVMANMDIADKRIPQDGRMSLNISGKSVDVRVASLPGAYGERLTLRLLDRSTRLMSLHELGMDADMLAQFESLIKSPYGCVLVTGPTGSGKSTTLYGTLAAVDRLEKNVITIEDPVEYVFDGINQIQINPKAGLTFASGLRSILRSDPDIIMVGEIRDKETAQTVIESALTGHLVFSSLHTNDAAGAISRLTEMGIEPFLTTSSVLCVLAQRLARLLCPHCKQPYVIFRRELNITDFPWEPGEEEAVVYRAAGCIRCNNTGYRGRVGIYEMLIMSEDIQQMTVQRRSSQDIRRQAVQEGMQTLRSNGLKKVKAGITSLEEMMRVIV
ncbi:Flp pilus assembly complex ATPase component TadA [Heliobacterium chlorum]|uniref:Flp pilus assembly complex ATPase component TadA n=1 Tax=Heliobacterium chlorum TaxID=2698 RepID=A0ABR7T5Y6_HELCL|nr:ATPase, T2SS/T4P/T4SS family [Heliobacterium chlorum]MBC9784956.1 Flp pilus assembly complex ATPase component TadA [Heliobacterium chlorum]